MNTPPPAPEKIVAKDVRHALQQRQWRVIRNNVTKVQFSPGVWTQFAEKGMPDFLAIHYLDTKGHALVLWVETKRLGGRLGEDQAVWHGKETTLGGVVITAFTIDDFLAQYEARLGWIHRAPYSIPGHQSTFELHQEN
jgi:hypothetical protein